ncbi:mechanosensitive ion channel family protein [Chloroflexota bacterium]
MQPDFITGSPWLETAWAAGIFLVSILVSWSALIGLRFASRRIRGRSRTALFPQLLLSLSRPTFILILAEGVILALSSVSYLESWSDNLGKASIAVIITMITIGVAQGGAKLLAWYLRRARVRQNLNRMAQRITIILALVIGLLVLLDYIGISISPLIAGLGIGGLAIALALQPTLGNFFAGTQIVIDRVAREGDFIELDDGTIRGYITDIGWRSTRIRTTFNNMVIIPNSRMADSVITNYYGPTMEMAVLVSCGVSYNANLPKVETVAIEVAKEVIEELDEAVKTFEPWVAYEEFGDSNINFWIWVQAKDRVATFRMKSEIIKRLKARLDKEGITINYPARLLTFERSDGERPPFLEGNPNDGGS